MEYAVYISILVRTEIYIYDINICLCIQICYHFHGQRTSQYYTVSLQWHSFSLYYQSLGSPFESLSVQWLFIVCSLYIYVLHPHIKRKLIWSRNKSVRKKLFSYIIVPIISNRRGFVFAFLFFHRVYRIQRSMITASSTWYLHLNDLHKISQLWSPKGVAPGERGKRTPPLTLFLGGRCGDKMFIVIMKPSSLFFSNLYEYLDRQPLPRFNWNCSNDRSPLMMSTQIRQQEM